MQVEATLEGDMLEVAARVRMASEGEPNMDGESSQSSWKVGGGGARPPVRASRARLEARVAQFPDRVSGTITNATFFENLREERR